jgi:hypothetical protein
MEIHLDRTGRPFYIQVLEKAQTYEFIPPRRGDSIRTECEGYNIKHGLSGSTSNIDSRERSSD